MFLRPTISALLRATQSFAQTSGAASYGRLCHKLISFPQSVCEQLKPRSCFLRFSTRTHQQKCRWSGVLYFKYYSKLCLEGHGDNNIIIIITIITMVPR